MFVLMAASAGYRAVCKCSESGVLRGLEIQGCRYPHIYRGHVSEVRRWATRVVWEWLAAAGSGRRELAMTELGVLSIRCNNGERLQLDIDSLNGTLVDRYAALELTKEAIQTVYECGYREVEPGGVIYAVLHSRSISDHLKCYPAGRRSEVKRLKGLRGLFVRVKDGQLVDFGMQKGHCEVAYGMRQVSGMVMTNHAIERAIGRGISVDHIGAAIEYGEQTYDNGAIRYTLTRNAVQDALSQYGVELDQFAGTVVISADLHDARGALLSASREAKRYQGAAIEMVELGTLESDSEAASSRVIITVYVNRELSGKAKGNRRPNRPHNRRNPPGKRKWK